MGSLIHSYGSDAILNAWNTSRNKNKQQKRAKDDAITKAILQGASTGDVPGFKQGSPAYTGIERKFGSQFTQGLAERGRAAKAQGQLELGAKNFELGMKFFNTANKMSEDMGEKAGAWTKKAYAQAGNYFKSIGMNVDMSHLYDVKTNRDNFNKAATLRAVQIVGGLSDNKNPTPEDIAGARFALVTFRNNVKGKDVDDMADAMEKTIAGKEKSAEANKTRQQQFEKQRRQQKITQENQKSQQLITQENQRLSTRNRNKDAMDLFKLKAEYRRKHPDTLKKNDRRILDERLVTMAITIENDPEGPGVKQAAKFYNDWAAGPSVYFNKKTKSWLGDKEEITRVELPFHNGKQLTAVDVRKTLAENKGMTLEDLLRGVGAIE
jgi:hypothetical protein